jgi:hypothetical protein
MLGVGTKQEPVAQRTESPLLNGMIRVVASTAANRALWKQHPPKMKFSVWRVFTLLWPGHQK